MNDQFRAAYGLMMSNLAMKPQRRSFVPPYRAPEPLTINVTIDITEAVAQILEAQRLCSVKETEALFGEALDGARGKR